MAHEETRTLIDRAASLIRKAEVKSVPREKIRGFLKKKNLNDEQIKFAYEKYYEIENLVQLPFPTRPLGFSVVMDALGKNCVVSSIQNTKLQEAGLQPMARIVKVNHKFVEHKQHQEIIDIILDAECPIKFTFRKQTHPQRGSLFERIQRPSKSLPAERSERSSIVTSQSSKSRKSGVIQPGLLKMAQKTAKARGSVVGIPERVGGAALPDSSDADTIKKSSKSNLISNERINEWKPEDLEHEKNDMMAALAGLMAAQEVNAQVTDGKESQKKVGEDHFTRNLSKRSKNLISARSEKKVVTEDMDDWAKDMFSLWERSTSNNGYEKADPNNDFQKEVVQQANKMRRQTTTESDSFITDSSLEKVPTRARMNSAPVYSNDALTEMKKGTALVKYGKRGAPKFRIFQLSQDNSELIWFSDKKKVSQTRIPIEDMKEIKENVKHDSKADEDLVNTSFSIIHGDGQSLRLTAKNETECYLWTKGLTFLIEKAQANYPLNTINSIQLEKRPGLNIHRRQSLATLLEAKTHGSQGIRKQNIKKLGKELGRIKKKYKETDNIVRGKKFINAMNNDRRMQEKTNIEEVLREINSRIQSLSAQIESNVDNEVFDIEFLKTDTWNVSVDLMALHIKLKVLIQQPRAL